MGSDKSLVELAGKPLIEHSLAALHDAGLSVAIAGAQPELASFAPARFAPLIEDPHPGLGPLAGVCSALQSTTAQRAVFLSVDLPLLPASLIACLVRHSEITGVAVTLVSVNGFPQTFPAVVDRAALPVLQNELDSGRAGCFVAFRATATALNQTVSILPVEYLVQTGAASHSVALPPAFWFLNVNAPADLARARRILAISNRVS